MSGATVVETHVSVVVLLGDRAYKFKKPVRLPFLDFSTAERRRRACVAEVEANRRLSPDVYLGVAELSLDGVTLDHAVVMRRLPAERSLAALVRSRPPPEQLAGPLQDLAGGLARFHAGAARGPAIDAAARPEALESTWRRCLDTLGPFAGRLVDAEVLAELRRLALGYLRGRGPLLERRIAEGRVCDGHGDLLADDVFLLDDGPRVLDCVEFDPALRHVDVAADLAFVLMDLERLGEPGVAAALLARYEAAAGARIPRTLLHHYCAQRAVVRAEVACLRAAQTGDEPRGRAEAAALGELGLSHLRTGEVVLGVLCGLPGTGKSTVARAVAERLGWTVLRSDEIRRELLCPGWDGSLAAVRDPSLYSDAATGRTYRTMLERARVALGLGQPVLLDATFGPAWARSAAEVLADDTASRLVVLHCTAPPGVAAARLRERRAAAVDVSGADEAVARSLAALDGPWAGAADLDTSRDLADVVDDACHVLQPRSKAGLADLSW